MCLQSRSYNLENSILSCDKLKVKLKYEKLVTRVSYQKVFSMSQNN